MGFWDIIKIFFILGLLTGVMYFLLYLTKRFIMPNSDRHGSGNFKINVVATQVLMPKKYVSVIKVLGRYYIIGITDNSISLLDQLEEVPPEFQNQPDNASSKLNFLDMLKKSIGRS